MVQGGYYEKHHIVPRSMGGSNKKSNLVDLTAREHYVCHRLLTKMVQDPEIMRKAWSAFRAVSLMDPLGGKRLIKMTSHLFEELRKTHAINTGILARARWADPAYKEKLRTCLTTEQRQAIAKKSNTPEVNERKRQSAIGRKHSEETKKKMSEARKKRFAEDPEYKRKILQGLKQFN